MAAASLREHDVVLGDGVVRLRPLTEADWETLLRWNSDPEVLYYCEGDDVQAYGLADVQAMYRGVSQTAFCFIIEAGSTPVGECWLQEMNLGRVLDRYPDRDCRRIDLMIGEKALWGRGIGTRVIRLLAEFGFERESMDAVFGCGVADYNPRSLRAFQKAGFVIDEVVPEPAGRKARYTRYLVLTRERFRATRGAAL